MKYKELNVQILYYHCFMLHISTLLYKHVHVQIFMYVTVYLYISKNLYCFAITRTDKLLFVFFCTDL